MLWTDLRFWRDASWRAFRTFCQSMAGWLLVVQTSNALPGDRVISIPWQAYLYASAVSALISLLQSVDRERAVTSATPTTPLPAEAEPPVFAPATEPVAFFAAPRPTLAPNACGTDLR